MADKYLNQRKPRSLTFGWFCVETELRHLLLRLTLALVHCHSRYDHFQPYTLHAPRPLRGFEHRALRLRNGSPPRRHEAVPRVLRVAETATRDLYLEFVWSADGE